MKYDVVQQSLEEFVQTNWTSTVVTFDNVAFNSDEYAEFVRCTVLFGLGRKRAINKGCYRQSGVLILSIYTKPGTGSARRNELATIASMMLIGVTVKASPPLVAPSVHLLDPDMHSSNKETNGWVQTQLSCPFYYDLEQ